MTSGGGDGERRQPERVAIDASRRPKRLAESPLKRSARRSRLRFFCLRSRNERNPNIAITVDLLTTGIDVPRIANLVFLRRVRSRILYEQMIGRATRLCPDIQKERFRIFDAVDLYSALKDVTDMKPVVVNPLVTFEQLAKEIVDGKEGEYRRGSIDEPIAKLQRKRRALQGEKEEHLQAAAGMNAKELARFLKTSAVGAVADYLKSHASLAPFLDRTVGSGTFTTIVSEKLDEVREVTKARKPMRSAGFCSTTPTSTPPTSSRRLRATQLP
jgi:type I restriction enzyme R subunit